MMETKKLRSQPKIDEIDAKILKTLLREARTTFTEIAKDCSISVGAVRTRFERLKRIGIITGSIMQINPKVLGYNFVSDMAIVTSVNNVKELMVDLKTKPYLVLGGGAFRKFNIDIFVVLPSIEKLAKIQEALEANPLIKRVETLIWVELTGMDHTENLVINPLAPTSKATPKISPPQTVANPCAEIVLDELDRQIAKILVHNARTPLKQIADQLGVSIKKVIQRYNKLRGSLLTVSAITVDLKKLGYKAMMNILIKAANKSEVPQIWAQLLEIPNIVVTIRIIGNYDLLVICVLEDFQDLFKLSEKVSRIEGIDKADIHLREPDRSWPLNMFAPLLDQTGTEHTYYSGSQNTKKSQKECRDSD
jgi:Lrp/AsnC family transcriptional regulator for asnA, asnC and gidA